MSTLPVYSSYTQHIPKPNSSLWLSEGILNKRSWYKNFLIKAFDMLLKLFFIHTFVNVEYVKLVLITDF